MKEQFNRAEVPNTQAAAHLELGRASSRQAHRGLFDWINRSFLVILTLHESPLNAIKDVVGTWPMINTYKNP